MQPFDSLTAFKRISSMFPRAFDLLLKAGVHPKINQPFFNPYTGKMESDDFRNVGEHCIAVAICAEKLAEPLAFRGVLDQPGMLRLVERALLHDLGKRYEVCRRKAQGRESGVLGRELCEELLSIGVDSDVAQALTHFGTEAGAESAALFLKVNADSRLELASGKLVEKIVRLADDMTASILPRSAERSFSYFVTFSERVEICEFATRYPEAFKRGFAARSDGAIFEVPDISSMPRELKFLGSSVEVEKFIAHEICAELKRMFAQEVEADPQMVIKEFVNRAIFAD